MDACLKPLADTATVLVLGWALCAAAVAEDAIRLPAWVESTDDSAAVEQTVYEAAPRPLVKPASPARELPPPRLLATEGFADDDARRVRQLEHAANGATTIHTLTRLLRRYEETIAAFGEATDPSLREQANRVGSWAHHARARLYTQVGKAEASLIDLRSATDANPANAAAWHDLAVALAETGETKAALDALDRTLRIDPASNAARQNRASLRLQAGDPEAAVSDCDAALASAPEGAAERADVLLLRGVALHTMGRLREAAADLDESLRLEPQLAACRTARGHVYAEAGYYQQAITDYRDSLDADPTSVEAYRSLAWVLATCPERSLRDPAMAIEAAWRARRVLGRDDFLTLDASAAAHAAAGEFAEAIRLQQRAILMAPQSADESATAEAQQRLRLYEAGRAYIAVGPATLRR
ncbi:lipoprotein NlpI [Botrimarina colliarenosi]|uniref:Lipoprotein NlpI n=1 Tax=Botrimarina colliarenosi TaxID=2528001 RepID=A0A5C6AH93_9BACT|nr:tetratricopeptide repeat protein [Botrimarina colliarenosi]TWT99402.1 lipoprotein NlpI [Botrimarina colliarenosi]